MQAELKVDSREVDRNLKIFSANLFKACRITLEQKLDEKAEFIKQTFDGHNQGFKDRTGALRRSIKSGIEKLTPSTVEGFISAGDDSIGSDGKLTRDYVSFVEFTEFRGIGDSETSNQSVMSDTSFLRPGAQMIKRSLLQDMKASLSNVFDVGTIK